ncbi:hypothetical protein KVR01_004169 [Diaporthe batatas]|uniref:uncharacterized protein n=1 Tax=Diaporthe batatas TaxID=748121 RepID=UPI001D0581DD|nr:uncharacterized protein KVR01_004169 [Diaporthe batatas]KAG8165617.1 hypothetical protein KVR01_004169 [Diaporthe batatas]
MTHQESNISQGGEGHGLVDGVAALSVTSPNAAFGNGSKEPADSASQLSQETGNPASVQSRTPRPLWNTPEGRIAGYRRMIEKNRAPDQRANVEALIRYYEEGGKVPEGQEEVWAIDGEASFGIRDYRTNPDQRPEGWESKLRFCDSSKYYQINRVSEPDSRLADAEGRVIL